MRGTREIPNLTIEMCRMCRMREEKGSAEERNQGMRCGRKSTGYRCYDGMRDEQGSSQGSSQGWSGVM